MKVSTFQQLLLLCVVVVKSCPPLPSQVRFDSRAVPCRVYSPENVWTALPTNFSLRPTTTNSNWTAQLLLMNDKLSHKLACLRVWSENGQVQTELRDAKCDQALSARAEHSADPGNSGSWVNFTVSTREKTVEVQLYFMNHSSTVASTMDNLPGKISLHPEEPSPVYITYDCQDGCPIYSSPMLGEKVQLMNIDSSSAFFVRPGLTFNGLQFNSTVSKDGSSEFTLPVIRDLDDEEFDFGEWNEIQVNMNESTSDYRVLVNGLDVLSVKPYLAGHRFDETNIFVKGSAYWALDCDPHTVSSVEWPQEDSTLGSTSSSTDSPWYALDIILTLTVVGAVGAIIDLILTLRLLHLY